MLPQQKFLDLQYSLSKKLDKRPTKFYDEGQKLSGLAQIFVPSSDELRRVFDMIDHDGDGKISPQDLGKMLKAIGTIDIEDEVKSIMWAMDADEDGFISWKEFMDVHGKGVKGSEIHMAFRVFDRNGDGRIGADDLMVVLSNLGENFSLDECRRMVRMVDWNGDGLIDMDDFMDMMTRNMKLQ